MLRIVLVEGRRGDVPGLQRTLAEGRTGATNELKASIRKTFEEVAAGADRQLVLDARDHPGVSASEMYRLVCEVQKEDPKGLGFASAIVRVHEPGVVQLGLRRDARQDAASDPRPVERVEFASRLN